MNDEITRIETVYRGRDRAYAEGKYAPTRPGELYMLQRREEETVAILRRQPGIVWSDIRVLDIGCGRGFRLLDWLRWGVPAANLSGIDLMTDYLSQAALLVPGADLRHASAEKLPFDTATFDIVVQSMTMTSILDSAMRRAAATEMLRVLKPGGAILWYDFRYRNPGNQDVRAIDRAEISDLFPACQIRFSGLTLLPPFARRLAPFSFTACRILERCLPPLRSHWLALIQKRAEKSGD